HSAAQRATLPATLPARHSAAPLAPLPVALPAAHSISRFFFEKKFPVDPRHNAKIHRLSLREKWAKLTSPRTA
ncbi:MAG: hypothetical protein LBT53_08605, partial [Puniceicoccales bacterium]|nr:hypothetical protein [Puniceicoccales bacterium]